MDVLLQHNLHALIGNQVDPAIVGERYTRLHGELEKISFVSLTLAYFLYIRGLAQTSTSNAATITLIEPVTATFLAAVILREAITLGQWIGIALVIAGLALVDRKN